MISCLVNLNGGSHTIESHIIPGLTRTSEDALDNNYCLDCQSSTRRAYFWPHIIRELHFWTKVNYIAGAAFPQINKTR